MLVLSNLNVIHMVSEKNIELHIVTDIKVIMTYVMYASCRKEQCANWVHGKDYLLKIRRNLGVFLRKDPKMDHGVLSTFLVGIEKVLLRFC